jgi:hypothetical protein
MPKIAFIPNDPAAGFAPRQIDSSPERGAGRAQIQVRQPGATSPAADQALFWQCRETALASLAFWETCWGAPLDAWARSGALELKPFESADGSGEPDAFFDGRQIVFRNTAAVRPALSVDVVTHELGHAILNAWNPALRNSSSLEHVAFHEAFGDALALLVALSDPMVATQALQNGLGQPSAAETLLESLATAIAQARGLPSQALTRHALNGSRWSANFPFTTRLTPEYELSLVFTGAIYDSIVALFNLRGPASAAGLSAAALAVGQLLARAVRDAPYDHNLFSSMGNSMLAATGNDDEHEALEQGFAAHDLEITATAIAQPEESFPTPASSGLLHGVGRSLPRLVARRFGLKPRRSSHGRMRVGARDVFWVGHEHEVDLRPVHASLKSVRTYVYQETWLTHERHGWAVVQRPRAAPTLEDAALSYVEHLYKEGHIANRPPRRRPTAVKATHTVVRRKNRRDARLERLRFACCG